MNLTEFTRYIGWLLLAMLALAGAGILGYWAPWYFAWVVGTVMIVLIAASAGYLYDRQALQHGEKAENPEPSNQ